MKKLIFPMRFTRYMLIGSIALFGSMLASCTYTGKKVDNNQTYYKNLPNTAINTLKGLKTDIDTLVVDDDDMISVLMKDGVEIEFENDGEWRKVNMHKNAISKEVSDLLPIQARSYLKENKPDKEIRRIERSRKNRYTVVLQGKEILHFSRIGKFMPNDAKRLPSLATSTLKKYFADDSILVATVDADIEYTVELASGTTLEFDRMGHFERVEANKSQGLPEAYKAAFPSLMMKYMAKSHPDKTIRRIIRKNYGYFVKTNKPNPVELCFSKTGDYLRVANKGEENDSMGIEGL